MKYIIVLCDGMADEPLEELGGRTPLEAAVTENLDALSPVSEIGMVRTVPKAWRREATQQISRSSATTHRNITPDARLWRR